jgi:hypothetical protein
MKTTPEIRDTIYQRLKAGEIAARLAEEYGVSRQLISVIQMRYKAAEASGVPAGERKRRNLAELIPQKLEALRVIVTTKTPAEIGYPTFSGWNYRAAQKVMADLFHFKMLKPEVEKHLTEWGALAPPRWADANGYIPPSGDIRPGREEVFEQDFYDYINSDIGRQVAAKSKEWEERERKEREEAIAKGWVPRKRGRPRSKPAPAPGVHPTSDSADPISSKATAPGPASVPGPKNGGPKNQGILTSEEIERRLEEARKQIGDSKVQAVLDHYSPLPKTRGSNFTPPKKKRRK